MKTFRNFKNYIYILMAVIVFTLLIPVSIVHAYNKELTVTLNKSYEKAEFSLEFENAGEYEAVLVTPRETEYSFTQDSETTAHAVIENVSEGDYKVQITKISSDSSSDSSVETDSSNDDDELSIDVSGSEASVDESVAEASVSDDIVGLVTVNVRAVSNEVAVSENVKVAKQIAGLKLYFKDDTIVTEWTDENVGNVHVTVTDTDTLEVLGDETNSEGFVQIDVPTTTKEIMVTVVPAESERVDSATEQYVLTVDNHPDATVVYEQKELTNLSYVTANIRLDKSYALSFYVNDTEVLEKTEILSAGEYTYDIPLVEGENSVMVYVIDDSGNMRSTSEVITSDTVPPSLTINEDINGLSTYDTQTTISGVVSDYTSFTINNETVEPDWEGNFEYTVSFVEGENHILVTAFDEAGNQTSYEAYVTMLVKEKKPISPFVIAGIVAIIGVGIFFFIRSRYTFEYEEVEGEEEEEEDTEKETKKKKKASKKDATKVKKILKNIFKFCFTPLVILLCTYIVCFHIIAIGNCVSGSMEPTIMTGDVIIGNRLAYAVGEPERGDIIDFYHTNNDGVTEAYLKRVIGVAGDTITFKDGYVFVNGQCAIEDYIGSDIETNCTKTFTVPDGCVFVLGDNRENSIDSRMWTEPYVEIDSITSKVIMVF